MIPGLSRPKALTKRMRRSLRASQRGVICAFIIMGTKIWGTNSSSTPLNPGSATPTIVRLWPFTITVFPITAGSELNRDFQYAWLRTTSGCPPWVWSSSVVKVRPRMALTPSTWKYVPDTSSAAARSVSPEKLRLTEVGKRQNMPLNTWLFRLTSS